MAFIFQEKMFASLLLVEACAFAVALASPATRGAQRCANPTARRVKLLDSLFSRWLLPARHSSSLPPSSQELQSSLPISSATAVQSAVGGGSQEAFPDIEMPDLNMEDDDDFDLFASGFEIKDPSQDPSDEELTNDNILRIILLESTDQETNELVWRCLGYRYDHDTDTWDSSKVFPKWREKFPSPPDLIGVRRIYTKDVDQPVLKANQALVKSIPMDFKNGIRKHLFGLREFFGLKMEGLTPNKTRRAQCANWLLYYRDALHGKSLDQLRAEKEQRKQEAAEAEQQQQQQQQQPLDIDVSGEENLQARRDGRSARLAVGNE